MFLQTLLLSAQENGDNAVARRRYKAAEGFLFEDNFQAAIPLYVSLLEQEPDNSDINFKLGFCYLNSVLEKKKAIECLKKAIECMSETDTKNNAPIDVYFYLGQAYRYNYKFKEAIDEFEKLKAKVKNNSDFVAKIDHEIQICYNGIELMQNPVDMTIENLGSNINSEYSDHSPIVALDESMMIFTSRRKGSTGEAKDYDGQYFEDIYISYNKNGKWTKPEGISERVNTDGHEAACSLSADGSMLFIHRDGDIYVSRFENNEWTRPIKLSKPVSTRANETHACLSPDGEYLFFTSDRKYGFGGLDIYMSKKLDDGRWGRAKNLGPYINTPYDEECPYISPDSILFFNSQKHKNIGGFDVFTSNLGANNNWNKPHNIGYPVSTTNNDIFYMPLKDKLRAYYSSQLSDGYGHSDIYMIKFEAKRDYELTVISGFIASVDNQIPEEPKITAINSETQDTIGIYFPDPITGKYEFHLPVDKNYDILYEAKDYLPHIENISIIEINAFDKIFKPVKLTPVKSKDLYHAYKMRFFNNRDTVISAEVDAVLNNVATILNRNHNLLIDVSRTLTVDYNESMEQRIDIVIDSLIKKGVEPKRISTDLAITNHEGSIVELSILDSVSIQSVNQFTLVDGTVTSADFTIPANVQITVTDLDTKEIVNTYTPDFESGKYDFKLMLDRNYHILFHAPGYLPFAETVSVIEVNACNKMSLHAVLQPVDYNDPSKYYTLTFFSDNDTFLSTGAELILNALAKTVAQNNRLILNVNSSEDFKNQSFIKKRNSLISGTLNSSGLTSDRISHNLTKIHQSGYTVELTVLDTIGKLVALHNRTIMGDSTSYIAIKKEKTSPGVTSLDEVVIVENIMFDLKQHKTVKYKQNLDKLVNYLKENPDAYIEIGGYTDTQGKPAYNKVLAGKRARFIQTYLLNKGVNQQQITVKNYGAGQQISINKNPDGSYNWGSLKYNRRVEFKVLKQGREKLIVEQIKVPEKYRIKTHERTYPFSIALLSTNKQMKLSDFTGIEKVREYKGEDGSYLYYFGNYTNSEAAEKKLLKLKSGEYPDAYIFINDLLK